MLTTCINWPNGTETFLVPCFRWLRVIRHHRPQKAHSPLSLYLCPSSDQGFSFSDVVQNDIFCWFFSNLAFLGGILLSFDSFRYNRDTSMKSTESIGWLYDWFTFSLDCVRGMKQKLRTSLNKISMQIPDTGARCTIVWVIRDGNAPYWHTHHILLGHIKF